MKKEDFSYINACIPALIVNNSYPIDLLHYRTEDDIAGFLSRMMWIHKVFNSSIGIVFGVPDDEVAERIESAFGSLMENSKNCFILIL